MGVNRSINEERKRKQERKREKGERERGEGRREEERKYSVFFICA